MKRSLLFIPSNNPAMLQNADVFDADAVIFDLEDAVMLSEKDAATALLKSFLSHVELNPIEKIIRINGLDTHLGLYDLDHIVSDHIDQIMLPKATINDVKSLAEYLKKLEKKHKMRKEIRIIPIIESAQALVDIHEIASCERVSGLLLGAEDLATDLGVERTEQGLEILMARSLVVIAAKAKGIDAIDTPYTSVSNIEGLTKDAKHAKSLGMNAKACIHPNQIEHINEVFSPSMHDIMYAQKVVLASIEASKHKLGAFSVDGKMIDKPIIERAQRVLEQAKAWHLI